MTHEQAHLLLHSLQRRWNRRVAMRTAGQGFSFALVLGAIAFFFFEARLSAAVALVGFGLIWRALYQRSRADLQHLTRHLNRTVPVLEESCELLLKSPTTLNLLETLQHRRLLQSLTQAEISFSPILSPEAKRFISINFALAFALVLGFIATQKLRTRSEAAAKASNFMHTPATLPSAAKLIDAAIEIAPPAYTGKAHRTTSDFNLTIEENATVTWRLAFDQPLARAALLLNNKDTLALRSQDAMHFFIPVQLRENAFYQFLFQGREQTTQFSDYFRLEIIADAAPLIVIDSLASRTVIAPGERPVLDLRGRVEDDYGVTHVAAFATLARGSGEAVRFREAQLTFDKIEKKSARVWQLQTILDLVQLDMAPGDELYFFLEAEDNREPAANRSRSETFFVVWQDTATSTPLASNGLLINPLPEYFRSQRQIILDTEKLIKDRPQLSVAEFQKRAQNLGFDQQALRMRYGEYLGEETETSVVTAAEDEGEAIDKHDANDKTSAVERIVEEFAHAHDLAENATLFSLSVKTQLKAALAEMWSAELHLRMFRPDTALPFEYRALALLKSVQQHNRVYVQRIGFEATPIKEEKRLTGDLSKISDRSARNIVLPDSTLREVRAALRILRHTEQSRKIPAATELATLAHASRDLAQAALRQSNASLRALQNYHAVLAEFEQRRVPSDSSLQMAQRALWRLLPTPASVPAQRMSFESRLAQKYFEKLDHDAPPRKH